MDDIIIRTSPIDSTTDIDLAIEQLTEIADGDLTVRHRRFDRPARRATLTIVTSRGDRFRERLAASPYARLYDIQG